MSDDDIKGEVFIIGKYRGKTFEEVYRTDAGYVSWAKQIDTPTGQLFRFRLYIHNRESNTSGNAAPSFTTAAVKPFNPSQPLPSVRPSVSNSSTAPKESLGRCLDAKWRRLTDRREDDCDKNDEFELHRWRAKRANTAKGDFNELTTLQDILKVTVDNDKPNEKAITLSDTSPESVSTMVSIFDNSRKSRVIVSSGSVRSSASGSPVQVEYKSPSGESSFSLDNSSTELLEDIKDLEESGAFKDFPSSFITEATGLTASSGLADTEATSSSGIPDSNDTNDGSSTLRIEGMLALVLYSDSEFYIAYQKPSANGLPSWTSVVPPELFQFLASLQCGMRSVKDQRHSYLIFHANQYDVVLKALRKALSKKKCPVDPIPNFILRSFSEFDRYARKINLPEKTQDSLSGHLCPYTSNNLDNVHTLVGDELYNQLKPFQREGVNYGIRRNGRVLIGDEMGLGKTLQALAISAFYRINWPLLIICPSSLRFQWREQCLRWLPHLVKSDDICMIMTGKTEYTDETKIVITSYDLCVSNRRLRHGFETIICDESHYLKNQNAKRTQFITPLLKEATRVILLSGTPSLNNPAELYEQLSCLIPSFCSSSTFVERYCEKRLHWFTKRMTYSGSQHASELHMFLVKTVMIRRLKENVLNELPPKIRSKVPIYIAPDILRGLSKTGPAIINSKPNFNAPNTQEVFRKTGEAKVKGVCDYVLHLIKSSVKFIIFAHHMFMMDAIEQVLKAQHCCYMRIDGSTNAQQRESRVTEFQNNSKCRVALLSLTACGVGLNLTSSSTVVFAELHWVPGQMIQAEDRAHRMGTKHRIINIHYLIAEGSIEETMWRVVSRKWETVTATLNGEVSNLAMTKESEKAFINEMAAQYKITELLK